MALQLVFKVSDTRLELLGLVEQGQHDRTDGGGSGVPVGWRNAQGRRKLAHSASMPDGASRVNPADRPQSLGQGCLNGYDSLI